MKKLITLALFVTLTGCASVQQAVDAYGAVAVDSVKRANDTAIDAYKVGLCGLPLSAIARHPDIVPAIRTLCLRSGDEATAGLLDAVERQAAK